MDLDLAVQQGIDRQIDGAIYKGCRLLDAEMTLVFEKEGKTFDLQIFAEGRGLDAAAGHITPVLRERRL